MQLFRLHPTNRLIHYIWPWSKAFVFKRHSRWLLNITFWEVIIYLSWNHFCCINKTWVLVYTGTLCNKLGEVEFLWHHFHLQMALYVQKPHIASWEKRHKWEYRFLQLLHFTDVGTGPGNNWDFPVVLWVAKGEWSLEPRSDPSPILAVSRHKNLKMGKSSGSQVDWGWGICLPWDTGNGWRYLMLSQHRGGAWLAFKGRDPKYSCMPGSWQLRPPNKQLSSPIRH